MVDDHHGEDSFIKKDSLTFLAAPLQHQTSYPLKYVDEQVPRDSTADLLDRLPPRSHNSDTRHSTKSLILPLLE